MAKNQKQYTQEFREQIVELYNTGLKTFSQLESEYGVSRATLHNWVKNMHQFRFQKMKPLRQRNTEHFKRRFANWKSKTKS